MNKKKMVAAGLLAMALMCGLLDCGIPAAATDNTACEKIVKVITLDSTEELKNLGGFDYSEVPPFDGKHAWYDVNDDVPFFTDEDMLFTGQIYNDLDNLGRCTYAMALVGPETLPKEAREDISSIKPTGWHQARYDGIDPEADGFAFNRCHLVGHQLTGQNVNERNLITGTRYMNVEGMLPFENSVRMYVEGTGNHVVYRVTPYFEGDELLCRGVLMEARSVEDGHVQFCAFCYNVQPGITLDYATGESSGPEYTGDRSLKEDKEDGKDEGEVTYILNISPSSRKFHRPSCESVNDMKEKNKKVTTKSREELINEGYSPCKRCNP